MDIKNINEEMKEKYGSQDSQWMKLEQGDNKIRILQTSFTDYGNHFLTSEKKSYACLGKEECPLCKEKSPAVKFMVWVIDREDGGLKILEFGYTVTKQLAKLANDKDYGIDGSGFPYDINIVREGSGKETTYSVIPGRKNTPLTEEEIKMVDELEDLNEIVEKKKEKTRDAFGVLGEDKPVKEDIPVIDEDIEEINKHL
jgi:hypothetical protein